jgi:type IV pilus assembly protein PilB
VNPDDLISHLVGRGLIDPRKAQTVLERPSSIRESIEQTLIENGLVEEEVLLQAMSEVYGLPYHRMNSSILDTELAASLPPKLMHTYCIYPLKREPGTDIIPLAMADPFDVSIIDAMRYITGYQITPVIARREEIENAIHGVPLGEQGFQRIADQVPWDIALDALEGAPGTELQSENSTPIIQLVNSLLRGAYQAKASDIHFESLEKEVRVRYRIDGILQEIVRLPKRVTRACVARIKIMAELDISESRKPQDGRIQLRMAKGPVDLRVSVLPTTWGEKVVMRLLDRTGEPPSLTQLGFVPSDLKKFELFLQASNGMILLAGPTGSGKTSTLNAALRVLNKTGVNISTVEDPVEYQVDGINQVAVNPLAGLTFASALRSFLRQDPDIIMVGEMRDLETARIAVQAAQTGHLVFSTLHTNDAPSTLERLILMGLEPHMVSGSLMCVVAQRLVRRLCVHCRTKTEATPEQIALLDSSYEQPQVSEAWKAEGCKECGGSGYRGRIGLYEILTVSARIKQQILADPSEELVWRVAREDGLKTLLEDGLLKVQKGLTSLEELLRVVTIKRRSVHGVASESKVPKTKSEEWQPPVRVLDVMTSEVHTLDPEETVERAVQQLIQWGVTGAAVVSKTGEPVGVFSLNDVAALVATGAGPASKLHVRFVMSAWVIKIHPYTPVKRAVALFSRHKVHRLIVMQGKELVGILTPLDLITRGFSMS